MALGYLNQIWKPANDGINAQLYLILKWNNAQPQNNHNVTNIEFV